MLLFWSAKGGSGTSVAAASVALVLARQGGARLVDLGGDQPAILGLADCDGPGVADWQAAGPDAPADALDRLAVEVRPGLVLVRRGSGGPTDDPASGERLADALTGSPVPTVVDAGPATSLAQALQCAPGTSSFLVTRACYVSLRRAVADPRLAGADGVVLIAEAARALRRRDVELVTGLPVVATVPAVRDVSRAVDAGTLSARLPAVLHRGAAGLVRTMSGPMPAASDRRGPWPREAA